MLSGQNGILNRAKEAKEASERSSIIENIKLEIFTKESEKLGNITGKEVYEILSKYGNILFDKKTLVTNDGKYEIPISSVYSGEIDDLDETEIKASFEIYKLDQRMWKTTSDHVFSVRR